VNRLSDKKGKISPLSFFSWQLNAKTRFSISSMVSRNRHEKGDLLLKKLLLR
jgi:hypothetical protein